MTPTNAEHNRLVVIVVGEERPIDAVVYYRPGPGSPPTDSGFTILFADAPDADELTIPDDERLHTVCLHCLIEDYPEVGRGLDLAKQGNPSYGVAERDEDGEWYIGTQEEGES